jgi:FAD/FMN-containing dehydrogenase
MKTCRLLTMGQRVVNVGAAELQELAAHLSGTLLLPGGVGYEDARTIWNGMIDKRPGLIIRCRTAGDVATAVQFAGERRLSLAVKAGGHNVAGNSLSDGGLVIDLTELNHVEPDPDSRTVRIGAGATLGQVDQATIPHGLATPTGVVTATGYAGLTLHGGAGWQLRKHGLAADNVVGYEIVTADGELRSVTREREAELFWALGGGGGNFGVVTAFTSRLHPIPRELLFAVPVYGLQAAPAVLRFLRDHMPQAPDELMVLAALWTAPEDSRMPKKYRGDPVLIVMACYLGDPAEAAEVVDPLRSFGPIADLTERMSWLKVQQFFDEDYPNGLRYYWKSTMARELTDPLIEALVEQTQHRPSLLTSIDIWALGGAYARADAGAIAFGGDRRAPFMVNYESNWEDPAQDEANVGWTRASLAESRRLIGGATYLNFAGLAEEGERLVRDSFGGNYERLQAVKAAYDPENLFRSNFNIAPAPAEVEAPARARAPYGGA